MKMTFEYGFAQVKDLQVVESARSSTGKLHIKALMVDGRRVRYLGIDAPEIANPSYDKKAEPLGYEALGFNRRLVHRKRVRLELDVQSRDAYDRVLAYVFLPGKQMVNSLMLVNGYAFVLPHHPNSRYESELLAAQRTAMQARRGIWQRWYAFEGKVIGNRPASAIAEYRNRPYMNGACTRLNQGCSLTSVNTRPVSVTSATQIMLCIELVTASNVVAIGMTDSIAIITGPGGPTVYSR